MKQMSELQLKIIGSYVYVYLKAHEAFVNGPDHDHELEAEEDMALSELSDMLTVFLDKPVHPRTEFNHIPADCDSKDFFKDINEIIQRL